MTNQNPGGETTVDLEFEGAPLKFTGRGYHDAVFASSSFESFAESWYFAGGEIGPYRMSCLLVSAINSSNAVNTGYLSNDGDIVQNQCSVYGTRKTDFNTITPYGIIVDNDGSFLPAGFTVEYTLTDGQKVTFDIRPSNMVIDQPILHRWVATAKGGKPGEAFEGQVMLEYFARGH